MNKGEYYDHILYEAIEFHMMKLQEPTITREEIFYRQQIIIMLQELITRAKAYEQIKENKHE